MKYQAMISIAGGPGEPVGEPQDDPLEAQAIARREARQWNCRTDWWIAPAGQDEEESE